MTRRELLTSLLRGAVAVAAAPLLRALPVQASDLGVSLRYVKQFTCEATNVRRIDCLYGFAALRPELAVRISDAQPPWWQVWRRAA